MPPGGQKPLRRPDISVPAIKDIWLFRHYLLDLWPGMFSTCLQADDYVATLNWTVPADAAALQQALDARRRLARAPNPRR